MPTKFEFAVNAFVTKAKIAPDVFLRKLALDAFTGVLFRSPVDTGRFRGNWRVAINRVDPTVSQEAKAAAAGAPPNGEELARASAALGARWGDSVYITNNVHYADSLEAGKSIQAPNGVLRPTFDEIKNNIIRTAEAIKRGIP